VPAGGDDAPETAGHDRRDRAVHGLGHEVGQDRAAGAHDHARHDQRGVVERHPGGGSAQAGEGVEQRDDHRHVGAADGQHHEVAQHGRRHQQHDHEALGIGPCDDGHRARHRNQQQREIEHLLRATRPNRDRAPRQDLLQLGNAMFEPQKETDPTMAANRLKIAT
jgi:hypothetical protein